MGILSSIKDRRRLAEAKNLFTAGKNFSNNCQYERAKRCYEDAIKLNPDCVQAWNNWGVVLTREKDHDQAIRYFDRAIKLDPTHKKAWNNKGTALASRGEYEEAMKCYEECIKLDPNYSIAWQNKGEALEALNRQSEADEAYARAKEKIHKISINKLLSR